MKKTFLLLFSLVFAIISIAQIPQKMSYQAIVRDSLGVLVTNTNISMRVSIVKDSINGTPIYTETHATTTNINGLVSIAIGTGLATVGTFASINWANTPYFISVETDITGGSNYSITGVQELTSVPYAFMASSLEPKASKGLFKHYIGELWGGGIVFNVFKDSTGEEHGLIATLKDLDTSAWSNMDTTSVGPTAQSLWDGKSNTQAIINQPGHITSAALICDTSTIGGQTDWYLPSVDEMQLLYKERYTLNNILRSISNSDPIEIKISIQSINEFGYWCSTEYMASPSNKTKVLMGYATPVYSINSFEKKFVIKVRAIRSF